MDNPLHEPINQCWSCWRLFADDEGVNPAGEGEPIVCLDCWEQIPIVDRLNLGRSWRTIAQGGSGVVDLLQAGLHAYPFSQLPKPSRQ